VIRDYFAQIKAVVDQYAVARFVLDVKVNFETRPGEQGYLAGSIIFVDGSALHFTEFLDVVGETTDKLMYTYHYQDAQERLIFRYDNARHRPLLHSLEHKHTPEQVVETPTPTLEDVLAEIVATGRWMEEVQ
jgi:hypothetical protein